MFDGPNPNPVNLSSRTNLWTNKASMGIVATSTHLLTTFFQKETGTRFTLVPYRGGAPAMTDLVAGQIDFSFHTPDQLPLMRAGSIKAYAVTGDTRLALAPAK